MNTFKYLLLLFSFFSFSQTKSLIGVVSDDANKPLESVNVIPKHNYQVTRKSVILVKNILLIVR